MVQIDIAGYAGKVIRDMRSIKNITLMELAQKVNISYQQLQKYENGQNRISVDRLYDIAKFLKMEITDFFPDNSINPRETDPHVLRASQAISRIKDVETKSLMLKLLQRLAA